MVVCIIDLLSASVDERMQKSQYGSAGWYRRPAEFTKPLAYSGMFLIITLF